MPGTVYFVVLAGACLVAWQILQIIKLAYFSPLSSVPNAHWSAPFSGLWNLRVKWLRQVNATRLDVHSRLGPVVRLGPKELSIACIDDGVRTVYGGNFDKSDWYTRMFREGDDSSLSWMFAMNSKAAHRERKKLMAPAYTKTAVYSDANLRGLIAEKLRTLEMQMREASTSSQETLVDILETSKSFTMDVVTPWLYGQHSGTNFLQDRAAAAAFFDAAKSFDPGFWRPEFPRLSKTLQRLQILDVSSLWGSSSELDIQEWAVNKAEAGLSGTHAIDNGSLQTLLVSGLKQSGSDPKSAGFKEVVATEMMDHVFASFEIASTCVAFAVHELSQHPMWQERLSAELAGARQAKGVLEFIDDVDEYRVLDAIWMETLRLHVPGPGPWPRVVPEAGATIGPYEGIPAGTVVSTSAYTLHMNPEVFARPQEWDPARWLRADDESLREMHKWWWAFGSGARICIGQYVAVKVIKNLLAGMYIEYSASMEDTGPLKQIDRFLASPDTDKVWVRFIRREGAST